MLKGGDDTMEYEYEKKMIGLLIGLTRKKLNQQFGGTKYTQVGLIETLGETYLENCELCQSVCRKDKICSKNILIEIEKGVPYKKECYYVGLIENLGYQYQCDELLVKLCQQIEEKLFIALSTYQLPDIMQASKCIDKAISQYPSIFYFSTLFKIYQSLVLMMLEDKNTYDIDEDILNLLLDHGNVQIKELVAILVYYGYIIRGNIDKIKPILNNRDKPYLFSYYLKIQCQNDTHSVIQSLEIFNQILKHDYQQLSEYNKYMLQNSLAFIHLNDNNHQKTLQYLIKCEEILENSQNQFPDYLSLHLINNLAVVTYSNGDYTTSSNYFLRLYQLKISELNSNIILLFNMLEKANQIEKLKELLTANYFKKIDYSPAKAIFRYYQLKHSRKMDKQLACELEELIIDDLILESPIHSDIIDKEILSLANITKDYKNYLIYTQKLKELQSL